MKTKKKRRAWTRADVQELKVMARQKLPAGRIAKKLKRSEGATRQHAFKIGLPMKSNYVRTDTGYTLRKKAA